MTPTEALAALDALADDGCRGCRKARAKLLFSLRDRQHYARKAAQDTRGNDWTPQLDRTASALADATAWAVEHLSEPHEAPTPKSGVVAPKPAPKVDDRPECPACGTKVSVKNSRIRSHRAASGNQCPRRFFDVDLTSVVRDLPTSLPSAPAGYDVDGAPMRPMGSCHDCDKWLPAGRLLCGQCARKRDSRARTG